MLIKKRACVGATACGVEDASVMMLKDHLQVSLGFGRKHRGESVKTGQDQGVTIDRGFIAAWIASRVAQLSPKDKLFSVSSIS